ncbi:MAG: DUF2911 domain-containing protein [Bacteroidetes bacterium]|nr:DUF2911 domain-containing protein [Bacteroidota bacterium]
MKRLLPILLAFLATAAMAQLPGPPDGDNQKARVSQWIGPVEVTITYSSPDVHDPQGKDRTGHIWGELVAYGFTDQGFGTSKAAPWRAGANENTTIYFSHAVRVNGKDLPAGTYALFLDVEKDGPWNWIFSKRSGAWGSYFYDPKDDVARTAATPSDADYAEYLTYYFDDRLPSSATAWLQWEKKKIGFKIEVPDVNSIYISLMRDKLEGTPFGWTWKPWRDAAQFCVNNKVNLEEALKWADQSISGTFIGQENFQTLSTKANVLRALGRKEEAMTLMDKAINLPDVAVADLHQYGRSLMESGDNKKALEVFKLNAQKHPADPFTIYVGLARGYAANGDKKNAIANWEKALKNVPENQKSNLPYYQEELKKLKEGK